MSDRPYAKLGRSRLELTVFPAQDSKRAAWHFDSADGEVIIYGNDIYLDSSYRRVSGAQVGRYIADGCHIKPQFFTSSR